MSADEASRLGDRFSRDILLAGQNPLTLRAVEKAIVGLREPALPIRRLFLVAEGAQFAAAGTQFEPNARLAFSWQASEAKPPDLLLSTVPSADDPLALLQLIAWSDVDGAFHFFERTEGAWVWAGNSFHALKAPTRGRGPFDSHINGSLVMKELKAPWVHWHSQSAAIPRSVFGEASEFNTDPLFAELDGAQRLEGIVKAGVRRWTRSRIDAHITGGELRNLPEYMRQILWCTSVNLVSSTDGYRGSASRLNLPTSFFYDVDALDMLCRRLDPPVDVVPPARLSVDAALYRAEIAAQGIGVTEDSVRQARADGDAHFAFVVPERAFEDLAVLNELVARQAISARLALALLLVDFCNPVFSPRRAALLRYTPDAIAIGAGGAALDRSFVEAVALAAAPKGSAEVEFLDLWHCGDLGSLAATLIGGFHAAIEVMLSKAAGVRALVALAESRREVVRRTRSLSEFRSTMPQGSDPPRHLAMSPDATLHIKDDTMGEGEN
jgi:hypothetical protein